MNLFRAIATVSGITMISRLFGFIRDIMVAAVLGAGPLADVFFVAFKLPNLFRRLFAEGAFNAAFVPQFSGILTEKGRHRAHEFAEQALAVLLWSLLIFVILVEITMPWIMFGFAPGFATSPEKFDLAVLLSRITFPYLLFISLVSLMSGLLNSLGRFAAAAATPILLNICLIGAVVWLANFTLTPAHALAFGVTIAGAIQLLWLLFHVGRAGIKLRLRIPRFTAPIRTMLWRIMPAAVGAGVYQISLLVDTVIASLLPTGSISYLFFADRVNQLPMGMIGVAVGTALLPMLSRQLSAGDNAAAIQTQNKAIDITLFLSLPAAAALIVIAEPTISVLFERGAFGLSETKATSSALAVYATGLPAYVMVKALTPAYFAREDTSTPVKIGLLAVLVNLVLNLVLMGPFQHLGIAAATSASAWLNTTLLAFVLFRRGHFSIDTRLKSRLPRMVFATVIMALFLYLGMEGLNEMLAGGQLEKIMALFLLVSGGLIVYFAISFFIGVANKADLKRILRQKQSAV
jgi:putative peptidoglycan lipid II flippase